MRFQFAAGLFAFCALAAPASAQWAADGDDFSYTFGYQVTGGLGCATNYVAQPCVTDAGGITLYNGDAFARITYTGVSGVATAANHRIGPVSFGTLHVAFGGTTVFTWPKMIAQTASFGLGLTFTPLGVVNPVQGHHSRGFIWTSPTNMASFFGERYSPYLFPDLGAPPHPLGHSYQVVFSEFNHPQLDATTPGDYDLTATVSLIPEPSTWAMMALGLAAVGVGARKRLRTPAAC